MARSPRPSVQSSAFVSLAPELLERIAVFCQDPLDVHRLAKTCAKFHGLIYASCDGHLWRQHYLRLFDDPRLRWPRTAGASYDYWRDNLQKRIAAREEIKGMVLNVTAPNDIPSDATMRTLVDIVTHTAPVSGQPSPSLSWISEQLEPLLKGASWRAIDWPVLTDCVPDSFHMRSRLLVYYGLKSESLTPALRTNARVAVYATTRYREASNYGPFIPDSTGRVDWYAIDSMMVVILMNLQESLHTLPSHFNPPKGLEATRPWFWKPQGEDWAGVTGNWRYVPVLASREARSSHVDRAYQCRRVVCFMDCKAMSMDRCLKLS
jgi:hypothetical protein